MSDDLVSLWKLCKKFIEEHKVSCAEATCNDDVYSDSPELVEQMAKIVGYYEWPD